MAENSKEATLRFKIEDLQKFLSDLDEVKNKLDKIQQFTNITGTGTGVMPAVASSSYGVNGGSYTHNPAASGGVTFSAGENPMIPLNPGNGPSPQQINIQRQTTAMGVMPGQMSAPGQAGSGMGVQQMLQYFNYMPGVGSLSSMLGASSQGMAGIAGMGAVGYLAFRAAQNTLQVESEKGVIKNSGQFVDPGQEHMWRNEERFGWVPFLGPMEVNNARAYQKMKSAEQTTLQTLRNLGAGSGVTGGTDTDNLIRNLLQSQAAGLGGSSVVGSQELEYKNGAASRLDLFNNYLRIMPEIGSSKNQISRFFGQMGNVYDKLTWGAPDVLKTVFNQYEKDFPFMQSDDARFGKSMFDEIPTMANRYALSGQVKELTATLATGQAGDSQGLTELGRKQMRSNLDSILEGTKSDVASAYAGALKQLGQEFVGFLPGLGKSLSSASFSDMLTALPMSPNSTAYKSLLVDGKPTISAMLMHSQDEERKRMYDLKAQIDNYDKAGPLSNDQLMDKMNLQIRYAKSGEKYASLGRQRGWGMLDYMNSFANQQAEFANVTGYNGAEYYNQEAGYYDEFLNNEEAFLGQGVRLNSVERMQMMTRRKAAKRQGIETNLKYNVGLAESSMSIYGASEQWLIGSGQTDVTSISKAMYGQMEGLNQKITSLQTAINQSQGFGPAVLMPLMAELAQAQSQAQLLKINQVDTMANVLGRAPSATASLSQFTGGSTAALPYLSQLSTLAGWRTNALAASGAGPGLLAESRLGQAQALMSMTDYSASPELAEKLESAQFNQSILSTLFSSRGSLRGAVREQSDAIGQQLYQLDKQRSSVLSQTSPEMRDAVEHRFNQQERQLRLQQAQAEQQLQSGWMERMVSSVWNSPTSASMVMNEFNYAGAVGAGVKNRYMGGTGADMLFYQSQSIAKGSFGGQGKFGTPEGFAASAFGGVTEGMGNGGYSGGGGEPIRYEFHIIVDNKNGEQIKDFTLAGGLPTPGSFSFGSGHKSW